MEGNCFYGFFLIRFKRSTNFIMVANFEQNYLLPAGMRLKKQTQSNTRTTFIKIPAKLSYASSPMLVRRTPRIQHGYQGFIHRRAILGW
jgi:hypothetical protein